MSRSGRGRGRSGRAGRERRVMTADQDAGAGQGPRGPRGAKGAPQGAPHAGLGAAHWAIVRRSPMFRDVPGHVLARLVDERRTIVYAPRQLIFSQGDRADGFFLVLDGWVKIFRLTPAGNEAVMGLFGRGETFAELVAFNVPVYPACAEAASELRVLKIETARIAEAMESEPGLAAALLGSVVAHTDMLFAEIASLKLMSAPRRLADFLLRHAPEGAASATLTLPYEKALLAGRLGMKPETLSRALAALRKIGVVVARDEVRIADMAALGRLARAGAQSAE